ncbi:hypothetical protein Clacol_001274 [Clathrus columnatus]|uniref:Dolichyl-diphosphooligosaccharide--protein glycosyltransferase subunit 1 n=1 Tax=Clathrus columnatus TaxID=1419009 RepID=A0AAV5A5A3_9AGAM|nr:hypothetical protein Clacol_001274 [Clathrus columnatus]
MQRAAQRTLRLVNTSITPLSSSLASSNGVQWNSKRHVGFHLFYIPDGMANPFNWVRERFAPTTLEPMTRTEEQTMRETDKAKGQGSVFDEVPKLLEKAEAETKPEDSLKFRPPQISKNKLQQKAATSFFKISHRKLNLLGQQISGKPIDYAILQMEFSHKRAAKRVKNMLVVARNHAMENKDLDRSKLIVAEAWVNKGKKRIKRIEPKGRGRMGIRVHPDSNLTVVLKEGRTVEEKAKMLLERRLKKIRSPGLMREDRPLIIAMRWSTTTAAAALLYSLPFSTFSYFANAAPSSAIENSAIVRTIELDGALTHISTRYTVRALENNVHEYTFALGERDAERTTWIEALIRSKGSDGTTALSLDEGVYDKESHAYLYTAKLPKALDAADEVTFELETIQSNAGVPTPLTVPQGEPQSLKYTTDLFVISPYATKSQRTKVRSPTPEIHSYTTPSDNYISPFDVSSASGPVKSGSTVTYGPYNTLPPSTTSAFHTVNQVPISIRYEISSPVLRILSLNRSVEISHWGSNLNIQDEIHLLNDGARLKGQFSRLQHQVTLYNHRPTNGILTELRLHLPAGISSPYFYDLNGNVSTSHFRPASVSSKVNLKKPSMSQWSILEFKPRYPILGGWSYNFTLGWDAPLGDSVHYDKKQDLYILSVPFWTPIPGASVDKAEVKIILPEAATDITVGTPFEMDFKDTINHITYLDTTGRPALVLFKEGITDYHTGSIYVSYRVPFSAHLKKPIAVSTAFMTLFLIALFVKRVDPRIQSTTPSTSSKKK